MTVVYATPASGGRAPCVRWLLLIAHFTSCAPAATDERRLYTAVPVVVDRHAVRQEVPNAVAADERLANVDAETAGGGQEQIGIRFCVLDVAVGRTAGWHFVSHRRFMPRLASAPNTAAPRFSVAWGRHAAKASAPKWPLMRRPCV